MRVLIAFTLLFCLVESRPNGLHLQMRSGPQDESVRGRIIGGQDAVDGQFPSMLTLEYRGSLGWSHICGAVLVRGKYALTAAHCVWGLAVGNLRVWAGAVNRTNLPAAPDAQLLLVTQYITHQNFSIAPAGIPNNIAILSLSILADEDPDTVGSAILPPDDTNDFNHGGCFVCGYGRDGATNAWADVLQYLQIPVLTNTDCTSRIQGVDHADIFDEQICVMGEPPTTGPCIGDAGGPLYCYPTENDPSVSYLAGVGSWNVALNDSCNLNYPTVFTRIAEYLDWIITNTPQI